MKALPLLLLLSLTLGGFLFAEDGSIKSSQSILNLFNQAEQVKSKPKALPLTRSFSPTAPPVKDTERKGVKVNLKDLQALGPNYRGIQITPLNDGTAEIRVPVVSGSAQKFNNILFEIDSTQFANQTAVMQLQEIASAMKAKPNLQFLVEGHTCDLGSEGHNHRLSEARADAVRVFLLREGVSSHQILTLGFGETDPFVANVDEANRRLNRRVVVYVRK